MEQFPPNSRKAEQRATEPPKRVERVTSAEAVRRKRPLGDRFARTFFGGDAKSAFEYMVANRLIPELQDLMFNSISGWFERYVYGDRQSKRGRYTPPSGAGGYISYNDLSRSSVSSRPSDRPPMPRALSRESRTRHDFDAIVIASRQEAEEVLDRLFDLVSQYGSAEVADLYELTGIQSSHQDHKWGWTDMRGARVGRVRRGNGYVLELPDPEFFQ